MIEVVKTARLLVRASLVTLVILVLGIVGSRIAADRAVFDLDTLGTAVFLFALTGVPLFMLALTGDGRKSMWLVAAAIMLAFWAFFIWQTRLDYLNDFEGGANIGLGLVMMAAPIVACLVLAVLGPMIDWSQKKAAERGKS